MPEIILAKSAGFCSGVARAVEAAYQGAAEEGPIATLGPLIHNRHVTEDLAQKGVGVLDTLAQWQGERVLIRAHGVPPAIEAEMQSRGIPYIDCTCPWVKRVHRYAAESREKGRILIVLGKADHPEVQGIVGYAESYIVAENEAHIEAIPPSGPYTLVAQTTSRQAFFDWATARLKEKGADVEARFTICRATSQRQQEAAALAKNVNIMVVLGDPLSANAKNLYEICQKNGSAAIFSASVHEIQLQDLYKYDRIGVTAGASTPPSITKEAILFMSELLNQQNPEEMEGPVTAAPAADTPVEAEKTEETPESNPQSFEEMLNESFVTLHTGDVAKGTVIQVTPAEITVNLGYKSDGIITKNEYTTDSNADLTELVKIGDIIEVYVMRVNDGDGNVLVSKRKLDAQTNYKLIEQAFLDKTTVVGKIQDLVKGGLIAIVHGNRVFVPSSQISNRFVEDLSVFKGKELNFNILEFDRSKRRIVAGRKELANMEQKQRREELYATMEIGQRVDGTVSRITDFGAFIDLGGVDGLVHISELAWRRVRKVSDVLSVGDAVTVTVIDINPEKNKISLTLKDINNNPWNNIAEKYPVGSLIEGKVVRMAGFGAFVNLEDGVDGLVHISQIAAHHIAKPEDELTIGQTITVKVTDVDEENKKISLSKKAADAQMADMYDDDYDDYDDDYDDDDYDDVAEEDGVEEVAATEEGTVAEAEEKSEEAPEEPA